MEYRELTEKAAEYMRLVLPLMRRHGVPMTPDNYTVWYAYVAGTNTELTETIQKMVSVTPLLSEQQCANVYSQFFDVSRERAEVVELRIELSRLIKEVINFIYKTISLTDQTNSRLNTLLTRVNNSSTAKDIHDAVKDILTETRQVMASGELLNKHLDTAMAEVKTLKKELEQSKQEAKTDTLTGVANRKAFDEQLIRAIEAADRARQEVCLIFCDLDYFKTINDKHGHLIGDQVLKVVANTLKNSVRSSDLVARYGGEEFSIILFNTKIHGAIKLADNIREAIAFKRIKRKDTDQTLDEITMSFGVAAYVRGEGIESFMQRADHALYTSKQRGRNCVSEALPPF